MEQEVLIQSIGNHVDYLQSIFNWAIILSIVIAWAGIERKKEIEALGLKIARAHAFYAICSLYLIVNVIVLIIFLRMADLLLLIDDKNFTKGLSTLTTHSWILNPFSYFGESSLARFYSCQGTGLLIVVWWLANASLSTLKDNKKSKSTLFLSVVFLLVGLSSLWAIYRVYMVIQNRLIHINHDLSKTFSNVFLESVLASFLGVAVGVLAFIVANLLQKRISALREVKA
jgi:hypothetical protein